MKTIFIIISFLIITTTVAWFAFLKPYYYTVELTHNVIWECVDLNREISQLINTETNEILIGPGDIMLWGKYPYLTGTFTPIDKNDCALQGYTFVYDFKSNTMDKDTVTARNINIKIVFRNTDTIFLNGKVACRGETPTKILDVIRAGEGYNPQRVEILKNTLYPKTMPTPVATK